MLVFYQMKSQKSLHTRQFLEFLYFSNRIILFHFPRLNYMRLMILKFFHFHNSIEVYL